MSDTVFILGAGASRQSGAPLMNDFLDAARMLFSLKRVDGREDDFRRVFETIGKLQAVHSKAQLDINNLESIFTVLEMGRIIRRIPGLEPPEIPQVISSLKEVIVTTIQKKMNFPLHNGRIGSPVPYTKFSELLDFIYREAVPRETVSVITFNYDIAADIAIHYTGHGPNYQLDESESEPKGIDLLKLHGSLNWAKERETGKIIPLAPRDYVSKYSNSFGSQVTAPISDQLQKFFSEIATTKVEIESEPVIVPPSWNKGDYHIALSNVWAKAASHLSEATNIYVIGYSLPETDAFFRHLYALGSVGNTPLRRFFVFDPDNSGQVKNRFESILGAAARARFEYFEETFDHAITRIESYYTKTPT